VLPAHLEPSLIDRLPESPGAYVFHAENNEPLLVGAAGNLKLHVVNYFRIDQATHKALEYSHRITNITWRVTRGTLGAQLNAAALADIMFTPSTRKVNAFTWQFSPDAVPASLSCRFRMAAAASKPNRSAVSRPSAEREMRWCVSRQAPTLPPLLAYPDWQRLAVEPALSIESGCACAEGNKCAKGSWWTCFPPSGRCGFGRGRIAVRWASANARICTLSMIGNSSERREAKASFTKYCKALRALSRALYRLLNRTIARLPRAESSISRHRTRRLTRGFARDNNFRVEAPHNGGSNEEDIHRCCRGALRSSRPRRSPSLRPRSARGFMTGRSTATLSFRRGRRASSM
jgi:hypothetical protein